MAAILVGIASYPLAEHNGWPASMLRAVGLAGMLELGILLKRSKVPSAPVWTALISATAVVAGTMLDFAKTSATPVPVAILWGTAVLPFALIQGILSAAAAGYCANRMDRKEVRRLSPVTSD